MLKFEFDLDFAVVWSTILLIILVLALLLFDIHYFIRAIFTVIWGKIFDDVISAEETSSIYGICTTNDLDIMFRHMNNARYVRELDFARFRFYERSKIYRAMVAAKGIGLQAAAIIKYRRSIPLFTPYKVTTKLVYWDEKAIYIEQQFITLSDGFVRAVALSKQTIVGVNVHEMMIKLLEKDPSYKPTPPEEVKHFTGYLDASSVTLRKKDD